MPSSKVGDVVAFAVAAFFAVCGQILLHYTSTSQDWRLNLPGHVLCSALSMKLARLVTGPGYDTVPPIAKVLLQVAAGVITHTFLNGVHGPNVRGRPSTTGGLASDCRIARSLACQHVAAGFLGKSVTSRPWTRADVLQRLLDCGDLASHVPAATASPHVAREHASMAGWDWLLTEMCALLGGGGGGANHHYCPVDLADAVQDATTVLKGCMRAFGTSVPFEAETGPSGNVTLRCWHATRGAKSSTGILTAELPATGWSPSSAVTLASACHLFDVIHRTPLDAETLAYLPQAEGLRDRLLAAAP